MKTEKRLSREGIAARLIENVSDGISYQMFICTPEATEEEAIALGEEIGFRGAVTRNSSSWFQCEAQDFLSELRSCEQCGRTRAQEDDGCPALGMTDLYFCPPGFGCSSVDESGRDRLARGRSILGTHAEGRRR